MALRGVTNTVVLLGCIYSHSTNIIVLGLACFACHTFQNYIFYSSSSSSSPTSISITVSTTLFYCLGFLFHFAWGNSNGFGTLNLVGTYILGEYGLGFLGVILFLSTFCAFIVIRLWMMYFYSFGIDINKTKTEDKDKDKTKDKDKDQIYYSSPTRTSLAVTLFLHGIHLAAIMFSILLQRHHLFIWSVYAPKFTYVSAITLMNFIITLVHLMFI